MRIVDCIQGTEEWYRARMGIATASEFGTILGVRKDAKEKKTRQTYMRKLAGEILSGEPKEMEDNYSNTHMERGRQLEAEARHEYSFFTDNDCTQIGFIANSLAGCSPDSLIGQDGALEIKTCMRHIWIEHCERGEFPPEHKAQCQGVLWITDRQWIDLCIYNRSPGHGLMIIRAERDNGYIATLAGAVREFNAELAELVHRVRNRFRRRQPDNLLMAG